MGGTHGCFMGAAWVLSGWSPFLRVAETLTGFCLMRTWQESARNAKLFGLI